MFDISFAELMIIAVVGLLVIGPDKLPQVARTLGAFMGRLQRYVAQVKEEVNREARFEDLQKLQQEIEKSAHQAKSSMMEGAKEAQSTIDSIQDNVNSQQQAKITKPPVKKTRVKKTAINSAAPEKLPTKKSPAQIKKNMVKTLRDNQKAEKA